MLLLHHREAWVGRVLFFEDIASYFVPLWTAVAQSFRRGQLPSWALGAWSGQPLIGDPQLGIFYPLHWALVFLDPVRLYALSVPLHCAIAALGTYAACRERGRSKIAASAAAVALSMSAFFVLEARHIMFLASAAWLPWLMWALTRYGRDGARRDLGLISAFSALALLGGGWSMIIFALPVLMVFAFARMSAPRLVGLTGALLLALGLAAVQLLPAMAHAKVSPRALPLAESFAATFSWPSLRYAVSLVLPLWFGDDARGTYTGGGDQWELCGYGIGVIATALACVSFLRRGQRAERRAYAVLLIVAAFVALGDHGPLWALWRHVPLLGRVRCPARALFAFTVVLPLLCADGLDHLRARLRGQGRLVLLLPIVIALELCSTFRAENPSSSIAQADITPSVIREEVPRDGRVLVDVHLGQAFHNGGLRWGCESPGGYSSLPLWRYLHLLYIANHGGVYPGWPSPVLAHDLTAQGLWTLSSPIVDLLNVRWLLAPHDRPPTGSGWVLAGTGADGIDLWRNDEALPRAFVVHTIEVTDDAATSVAQPTFDPARVGIVERPVAGHFVPGPPEPARLAARTGSDVHLVARSAGDGLLVLSEPFEPSWTVVVDGRPAVLLLVDYALMGVALADGEHRVDFIRIDRPLRLGAAVTLVASLLLLLVLLRRPRS